MTTIDVRMYNVGFGDAFRVTVRDGQDTWRMLVDCGVHSQGQARSISESVKNIIADLAEFRCPTAPRCRRRDTPPPRPHQWVRRG